MGADLSVLLGSQYLRNHHLEKKQCRKLRFGYFKSSEKILFKIARINVFANPLHFFHNNQIYRYRDSGKRVVFHCIKCGWYVALSKKIPSALVCLDGGERHLCHRKFMDGTIFYSVTVCRLFCGFRVGVCALAKTFRKINHNHSIYIPMVR